MARLELDSVSKIYGPRPRGLVAVDRLSLALADGEVMALLGSSGCGKTSTLRMIAGFEEVSTGAIRVGGRDIHQLAPAKRNVAMAFEGYSLYPPLTVRDNIAFALLRDRTARDDVARRVAAIAALLEIEDVLGRYPVTIASGQQQRASLARALVREADLYLLDEPMSQLEPRLRAILRARIKDFLNSRRMTTVFVTHDQTEAIALADRIAVMEKGELMQYGTPEELKERPANLFVAGFIGEPAMNLYPAELNRDSGTLQVVVEKGRFVLPLVMAAGGLVKTALVNGLAGGRQLHLGLRPHRLTIGGGDITGEVIANFWLGDQSHLAIDVGGARVIATSDRPVEARLGERIGIGVPLAAMHLFDSGTGKALFHAGEPA
ncbi:Trehalose import ATP-binding protein SugC [bacterium YEK0313]|nr:Trehalose import ATP-binding protein SugC [bacterium YEK0313]